MKTILKFNLLVGLMLWFALATTMHAQTAEEWLKQAEVAEAEGRTQDAASAYSGAAHEQMKNGDYEAAGRNFEKAAEGYRKVGKEAQANAEAKNAGNAFEKAADEASKNGDHNRAADLYAKAAEQYDAAGLTNDGVRMRGNADYARKFAEYTSSGNPKVTTIATGTGRTIKNIANISVTNNNPFAVSTVAQSVYIPAKGNTQDYVGRIPEGIVILPNETTIVPVDGICVDPAAPPVGLGDPMSDMSGWIPVGGSGDAPPSAGAPTVPEPMNPPPGAVPQVPDEMNPPVVGAPTVPEPMNPPPGVVPQVPDEMNPPSVGAPTVPEPMNPPPGVVPPEVTVPVVLVTTPPVPEFNPTDIPDIVTSKGFTPSPPPGDIIVTWPGTNTPVGGTFNPKTDPRTYARVIVDAVDRIEIAAREVQGSGQYTTPFTPDPPREYEALCQHSVWIFAAAVTDGTYDKDAFERNVHTQMQTSTGIAVADLPDEQQEAMEAGVSDFWNAYMATGVEAKVIRSDGTTEAQIFPGLEKDKIKDNLEKQGDQVEGQSDENPQQAPGSDTPNPGTTAQEEEEEADCKCESLTFTVATDFGGLPVNSSNETVSKFSANKSTPHKVVKEVDEDEFSQKMTIYVSDIKVFCNCEDAQCEFYSGKPSADNKGKVAISDIKVKGADAPKDGQVVSGNGISVDATADKTSANYFITFKVSATCTLEDCGEDVCIRYVSIEIKPEKK